MSYTPPKRYTLAFDIETLANPENLALAPEPKAPGNLKDPAKIAAAIEEKKRDLIEMAALDPDYGKILSIGMAKYPDGPIVVKMVGETIREICTDEHGAEYEQDYTLTEADLLTTFWQNLNDCGGRCIGFNILSFDLPYLMRRSMALGVKVRPLPVLAKYRLEPVTDLYGILYNWDYQKSKGLKTVARLYGLPIDCPDVDGSMVKDLDRETLRRYQASDVRLVIELFKKMNGVYFSL